MVGKPGNPKCGNRHDNIIYLSIVNLTSYFEVVKLKPKSCLTTTSSQIFYIYPRLQYCTTCTHDLKHLLSVSLSPRPTNFSVLQNTSQYFSTVFELYRSLQVLYSLP